MNAAQNIYSILSEAKAGALLKMSCCADAISTDKRSASHTEILLLVSLLKHAATASPGNLCISVYADLIACSCQLGYILVYSGFRAAHLNTAMIATVSIP